LFGPGISRFYHFFEISSIKRKIFPIPRSWKILPKAGKFYQKLENFTRSCSCNELRNKLQRAAPKAAGAAAAALLSQLEAAAFFNAVRQLQKFDKINQILNELQFSFKENLIFFVKFSGRKP